MHITVKSCTRKLHARDVSQLVYFQWQIFHSSSCGAPEVKFLQGFEVAHAGRNTAQHVVGAVQALNFELAHALRELPQIVGAQVKLCQRLAVADVLWEHLNPVVL